MTGLKKFLYHFTGFVAVCVLLQLPFAFATSSVLGDPKTIDTALKDSGAYDRFVPLALDNLSKDAKNQEAQQVLNDKGVRDAITSSIKTSDIEASGQSIISGVYGWLEGKTKLPEFTIDLSRSRDDLVKNLSAYAEQRSASLPVCTVAQLQTLDPEEDILSLPCLPPGVSPAQIGQQFSSQALDQVEFLRNPVITDETLLKETDVAKAEKEAEDGPRLYQGLHDSKWITLAIALILTALLIFARKDRLGGLKYVAKIVLGVGIFIGIVSLLFAGANPNDIPNQGDEIGVITGKAVVSILKKINDITKWFALGYIAAGGLTLLYLRKRAPKTPIESKPAEPVTTA